MATILTVDYDHDSIPKMKCTKGCADPQYEKGHGCLSCLKCLLCGENSHLDINYINLSSKHAVFVHSGCIFLGNCHRTFSVLEENGKYKVTVRCECPETHQFPSCQKCHLFFGRYSPTIRGYNGLYHEKCLLDPGRECTICHENVGKDFQWFVLFDGTVKYIHNNCLKQQKCHICGTAGEKIEPTEEGNFKHSVPCRADLCESCDLPIGIQLSYKIEGRKFWHSDCFNKESCYLCNGNLDFLQGIIQDGDKLRHFHCDPSLCPDCLKPLANDEPRTFGGKKYHSTCGPVCCACGNYTENDNEETLLKYGNDEYLHPTCVLDPCVYCGNPMGNEASVYESFQIHQDCTAPCGHCSRRAIFVDDFPLPYVPVEDFQYLHPVFLRTLHAFLVAAKFSSIESFRKVPKDVLKMIIGMVVNIDDQSRRSYNLRCDGQIDLYGICTVRSCPMNNRCKTCGKPMSWFAGDVNHCTPGRCTLIVDGLQTIEEKVFGRTLRYGKSHSSMYQLTHVSWPQNHDTGMKMTVIQFVTNSRNLSHEQITFYNAMIMSLKDLFERSK